MTLRKLNVDLRARPAGLFGRAGIGIKHSSEEGFSRAYAVLIVGTYVHSVRLSHSRRGPVQVGRWLSQVGLLRWR